MISNSMDTGKTKYADNRKFYEQILKLVISNLQGDEC